MILTNQATLEALARLRNDPDFQKVVQLIEREHETTVDFLLEDLNPVSIHKNQGRALCLADILQTFKSAATVLAKR